MANPNQKRATNGTSAPATRGEFVPGTFAIAKSDSRNKKIGDAATTYAAQTSCPKSCVFFAGGGCYAEAGQLGMFVTAPLNRAANAVEHDLVDVARGEAAEIDKLDVVRGRPLRLHTVGDCATDEAAQIVAAAGARYRQRGGGEVWTYTHAWRDVARESWGEVSVLASCETAADAAAARARGYATAITVLDYAAEGRHVVENPKDPANGTDILPCPQQTRGVPCSECTLCFDDAALHERGYSIAFKAHGTPFSLRQIRKALLTPDDPDRRLTSRQRIPTVITEIEAEGGCVTTAEIARRLEMTPSSVSEMRKKLEQEQAEHQQRSTRKLFETTRISPRPARRKRAHAATCALKTSSSSSVWR